VSAEFNVLFTRAAKLMRGAADEAMRAHGVRVGQNLVLEALWDSDGLTPGEIAARLRVATPTVVKMATRMEGAGLVSRRRDEKDARLVRLYLTDRGRELEQPIQEAREELQRRAIANLTKDERRHLESALRKMIGNLEEVAPSDEDDELA
jgi:MarR family transcriptional regulator for hemolysin